MSFAKEITRKLASVQNFKNIDLGEVAIIVTRGEISREDVEKARKEYRDRYEIKNSSTQTMPQDI